jgi:hypothetical protein
MFRIAPIVLFAASLSCLATAQAPKNPIKPAPASGGLKTVAEPNVKGEEPIADGTVLDGGNVVGAPVKPVKAELIEEPPADGTVLDGGKVIGAAAKPLVSASLKMYVNGLTLEAHVHSSEPAFMGIVGLSLTKDLTYSYGLPPLLTGAVVMAFGATDTTDLGLRAPLSFLSSEPIALFGQALVIDEKGFWSSNVVGLTTGGKADAAIN